MNLDLIGVCKKKESISGVQWRKENLNPWVHRSEPRFPLERMDPRVEIFLSPLTTHDGFYFSFLFVDCGFEAHKKCSEKVPNDCMPDIKFVKSIFGADLTTVIKAHKSPVPIVVEKCIKEIEHRGNLK